MIEEGGWLRKKGAYDGERGAEIVEARGMMHTSSVSVKSCSEGNKIK